MKYAHLKTQVHELREIQVYGIYLKWISQDIFLLDSLIVHFPRKVEIFSSGKCFFSSPAKECYFAKLKNVSHKTAKIRKIKRNLLFQREMQNLPLNFKKYLNYCMNSIELVIPLHFISWKKTPNNAVTPQRQSQFTPKMKANAVPRLLSSWV